MRDVLTAALLSVGLVGLGPATAQEIAGSAFIAGDFWQGSALTGVDGLFLSCAVSIAHGEGQELWFLLRRDDTFHIVLSTPAGAFTPGETLETAISINGEAPFRAYASATDAQNLLWSFPGVDASIAYFRQSGLVTLTVSPTLTLTLGTPGIAAALDAARTCLQTYSAPG